MGCGLIQLGCIVIDQISQDPLALYPSALFLLQVRGVGASISDAVLAEKAKQLASENGQISFKASRGWISKFKKKMLDEHVKLKSITRYFFFVCLFIYSFMFNKGIKLIIFSRHNLLVVELK